LGWIPWFRSSSGVPARGTPAAGLDVEAIVALHLMQLARCGASGTARARRIGPGLLAAARRRRMPPGPLAVQAAFALLAHSGEFPPVQRPCGGMQ
jgi:hypothetical protein